MPVTAAVVAIGVASGAAAGAAAQSPTTESGTLTGDESAAFSTLRPAPGWARVARQELGAAQPGRDRRRASIFYLAAIDEVHYTDEESPARVEFLDIDDTPFTAAWHAEEALAPFAIDQTFRTVNRFGQSPVAGAGGRQARLALALTTGDSADNQQANEISGYVRLLEGGTMNPNSGVEPATPCPAGPVPTGEAARYTGVQDYNDYAETRGDFYDPNDPAGRYASWPRYPGLMDRAQRPFAAQGLSVPSYVTLGNHDRLQQGNQWANASFEAVATGCVKPFTSVAVADLRPDFLSALSSTPDRVAAVPPDPERRSVDYPGLRALHATGRQADAHGFGYVDRGELAASRGAASYYSFSPRPGIRFISLNTVSEGGVTGPSANGNIDDPQFRWLARELDSARGRDELVVAFAHHPIQSLDSSIPDEDAPACGSGPGRDPNPGCDRDPRDSRPLRNGADLASLFASRPNVVAYVAGHTGRLAATPFRAPARGGFWQIESGGVYGWPVVARLVDMMDNRDGTLSLFGTMVAQQTPPAIPASGTPAGGFSEEQLASISRVLSFNDFQGNPTGTLGKPQDRNVELLVGDPRRNPLDPTSGFRRRCASLRGRIAGRRVHRVRLGARRRTVRRAYSRSTRRSRGQFDYFCLADGRLVRVGYPGPRLLRRLGRRQARRVRGRAAVILTSSRFFSIRGIRPGTRAGTLRRRLRGERRHRIGRNTYYSVRGREARLLFRVRRGRVRALGVADGRLTRKRAGERTFLRGFRP